eukprot:3701989-Alexandrium_andersonii.AAC.1
MAEAARVDHEDGALLDAGAPHARRNGGHAPPRPQRNLSLRDGRGGAACQAPSARRDPHAGARLQVERLFLVEQRAPV